MTNERLHEVLVDCQYIPGEYLVSTLKIRRVEYFEKGEKIPYILYVIHIGGLEVVGGVLDMGVRDFHMFTIPEYRGRGYMTASLPVILKDIVDRHYDPKEKKENKQLSCSIKRENKNALWVVTTGVRMTDIKFTIRIE